MQGDRGTIIQSSFNSWEPCWGTLALLLLWCQLLLLPSGLHLCVAVYQALLHD